MYNEKRKDETFSKAFQSITFGCLKIVLNWQVTKLKSALQKLLIIAVAFLTFGAITPSHEIWNQLQGREEAGQDNYPQLDTDYAVELESNSYYADEPQWLNDHLLIHARERSFEKFGSKIGPVIEQQFDDMILPEMEKVIHQTLLTKEGAPKRLAITEKPSGHYHEKIFHVYDRDQEQDLIRFHVRTEKRPQDGYFYHFHYHLAEDQFTAHYAIGDIFWSKNTPPKWLS